MRSLSMFLFFLVFFDHAFSQRSIDSTRYISELVKHQQHYKEELVSIINNDTSFVSFYHVQPSYCLEAIYEPLRNQPVFNMGTSSGKTKQAQKIGLLKFTINNTQYQLSAYQLLSLRTNPDQQDLFFIPFTDGTSGDETYSAGRYLDFKLTDIHASPLVTNGLSLIIDFNKAYNPYCAFVDGYNCPIPPPENQIEAKIKAGEKSYGKKWK